MKKSVFVVCLLALCLAPILAFAQNKVVVVPLNSSKSNVQHYRIAEQIGASDTGCQTATFTTPAYDTEAVLQSNVSISPTANDSSWWHASEYSTDGGSTWTFISDQVTISGAVSGTSTNNSETTSLDLTPNTDYIFRLDLRSAPTHSSGQGELFITFNRKATNDIVTVTP
ncbi:MAG: hypothetical protein Kow0089_12410 [Desulfobulbaceae bacterium]